MGNAVVLILRQIASVRVKTLSKIKLVSSRQNKGEKAPLLVDMGGFKTPYYKSASFSAALLTKIRNEIEKKKGV